VPAFRRDTADLAVLLGVDPAVSVGAGSPRYAHTDDERAELDALAGGHEVLTAFLIGRSTRRGRA
jgi:acetylornithine deacetylase/succinyl-diaminopimelate desuccinylase-like protein